MSRSRVPGYREELNVYQTFACPRTDSAWTSASLRMDCNVGGKNPYYCIPNAERTHFVEFCYDRASMNTTERGNCWELGGKGYLNQVNCTNFVKGCPDYKYLSEQVYKIPACLDLNFSERCFTEEPGCTVLKNSTNALVTNQTNADTSLHPGLVALITCVSVAVILLLVVLGIIRLRRKSSREEAGTELPVRATLLGRKDNKGNTKSTSKSQPVDKRERDITPVNVKGHISHLHLSKTGDIWASNDSGKVGVIDPSGKDEKSIETFPTYTGHFTLATVDDEKGEDIYWVHKKKKVVIKNDKLEHETHTGKWTPISIFFSAEDKLFHVGMVKNNDAKITRYNTDWTEKDDIHRYTADGNESKQLFRYPAYLVKNTNGDLCVSDNKRVVVVDTYNNFRFNYTGFDQNGFTPYGISTDRWGYILIVDSSTSCVHIINQEGDFRRYIRMSEHLAGPRGLCIDKSGKCLVGSFGTISVYNYTSDDTQTTKQQQQNQRSKI